ncbi:MAG: hypothetical protein IIC86_02280 [Chloroflexi bacterium]|nr:hypothetical protein [Chloroflexota bacterium]
MILFSTGTVLEMIGSIIALYAVIDYAAGYRPELVLHVERDELPFTRESWCPRSGEVGLYPSPASYVSLPAPWLLSSTFTRSFTSLTAYARVLR